MAIFGGETLEFTTGLDLSGLQRDLKRGVNEFNSFGDKAAKALGPIAKAVAAVGLAAAGIGAALGKGAIETGAEFEALEARLSTLLGSAEAGAQRISEVFAAASTTPFELSQLVEAEATLEAFGVDAPTWRTAVMDLSAALGIDLVQSAESVGRAFAGGAGAADVLRDRGVLAMVELREGVKATEMSALEFQDALFDTLTDPDGRIAGGTERMAATFSGLVSNLQDQWSGFQLAVSDAGIFDAVKASLGVTLDLLNQNKAAMSELAETTSSVLVGGLKAAITTVGFLTDAFTGAQFVIAEVARLALNIGLAIAEAGQAALDLLRIMEQIPGIGTINKVALDALQESMTAERESLEQMLNSVTIFGDTAAESFGQGAAAAVAYNDAIDEAVNKARTLGEVTTPGMVGGADNGTADGTGTGTAAGTIEQTDQFYDELIKINQDASDLATQIEREAQQQRIEDLERYAAKALGIYSDFAQARIAGEESLGQTVKRIVFQLAAEQLMGLAQSMAYTAAAYFAAGRIGLGALYTAGAATAATGAAVLGAASTGAIGGGGGSSSAESSVALPETGEVNEGAASEFSDTESYAEKVIGGSSGSSSRSTITVVNQIGHRTFDALTYDALNTQGSTLGRAMDSATTRGTRARV